MRKTTIKKVKGEPFCFWVSSNSKADWHRVDMTERGGHGVCTCESFMFSAGPNLRRIGRRIPYGDEGATECRHIAAANAWLQEKLWRPILAAQVCGVTPEFTGLLKATTEPASRRADRGS